MNRNRPIDRYLTEQPLFAGCRKPELRDLSGLATNVRFKSGRVLTREGEVGEEFIFIEKGRAAVLVDNRIVRTLAGGEFFGEIALLRGCRRTATVYAETDLAAEVVSKHELRRMLDVVPRLADTLQAEAERRLKSTHSGLLISQEIS